LENKAHRSDPKWRLALSAEGLASAGRVPATRLAAPLAWGANLWLLMIGWPWIAESAGSPWLALAAATPLIAGALLAAFGQLALASGCFLVAFPLAIASAVAASEQAAEPSLLALTVIAASMWVYGTAVARALRLSSAEQSPSMRVEPLQGRGRSPRHQAARLRAGRVRNLGVALTVAGAIAIAMLAPGWGDTDELYQAFGDDPRHASVLIAMVAAAIGVGVVSVFTTALVRPPTPEDRRPFAPMRAALGLVIALVGATTYYILR
jgi:hypothetical protein